MINIQMAGNVSNLARRKSGTIKKEELK